MASNQYVNKVVIDNESVIDLTNDTVTPSSLQKGFVAHDRSGASIIGMGTGSFTSISDGSEAGPISILTAEGHAEQDGTPTSANPVEIQVVRGRNLWPFSSTWSADTASNMPNVNPGTLSLSAGTYIFSFECVSFTPSNNTNYQLLVGGTSSGWYTTPVGQITLGKNFLTFTINKDSARITFYTGAPWSIKDIQLERGSIATPYVPYGHVGLEVHDATTDALISVTPIPLPSRGWVAGLPDGTADILMLDGAGKVAWNKKTNTTTQAVTDNITGTVGVDILSTTGAIADGATVLYKLATSVSEYCGYVDLPHIPVGSSISIPDLDNLNVEYFIDESVVNLVRAWYSRYKLELVSNIHDAIDEIDSD